MVSLLYQLALSLSLIVIGALFYRLTGGKRPNVAVAPSKVTYRIRNIPARYSTREQSRKVIEAILSTPDKPCTIKVRSFATNIDHNPTRTITTRTVTFDLDDIPPPQLKPNAQNEWTFKEFDNESQQTDDYLIIDTHFVGFTVLSSPKDVDHYFEYLLCRRLIQGPIANTFTVLLRSLVLGVMHGAPSKRGEKLQCGL
jgi:hypothetical protein